jgi:RNA polymerase sigma-70 factor (sigma-E family)
MGSSTASFDEFVRANAGALLKTAVLITWDDDEAEDVVQECLLRLSVRWRRVQGMDMPLAYARRILVNLALAGRDRRFRRRFELAGHDHPNASTGGPNDRVDLNAEALLHSLNERSELIDALGHLTPQQRIVLVLRYFEDLSEAQVADLLGCSTGTVKSSASRGVARLRALLSPSTSETEVCEP